MSNKIFYLIGIIIIFLSGFLLFYNLGEKTLVRWDEDTNRAVISGSGPQALIGILKINGKPFIEKPPLWYSTTWTITKFFGVTPLTLRIISATCGILIILIVFIASWKLISPIASFISIFTLLGTGHLFISGSAGYFSTHNLRSSDSDGMFLLFFILSTIFYSFYLQNHKMKYLFTGSLVSGLSILTKSPLGIIPIISFLIIHKQNSTNNYNFKYKQIIFFVLLIALFLPAIWYLMMFIKYGSYFLKEYFGYHIFLRTLLPIEGHANPIWFYATLLTNIRIFPAIEFALIGAFIANKYYQNNILVKISILNIILIFIICTVSGTRLSWYIFPIYPFLSILTGVASDILLKKIYANRKLNYIYLGLFCLLIIKITYGIINILFQIH